MTPERVREWAREASRHLEAWERRFRDKNPNTQILDIEQASFEWQAEFARLARADAFEMAKEALPSVASLNDSAVDANQGYRAGVMDCYNALCKLAAAEKEPAK